MYVLRLVKIHRKMMKQMFEIMAVAIVVTVLFSAKHEI